MVPRKGLSLAPIPANARVMNVKRHQARAAGLRAFCLLRGRMPDLHTGGKIGHTAFMIVVSDNGARSTSERIALLEDEIALMQERVASCEKFILGARIAVAAGLGWAALLIFGFGRPDALSTTLIVSAVIGGFVFWGSNKATLEAALAQLADLQRNRKELIETLTLRDITLH